MKTKKLLATLLVLCQFISFVPAASANPIFAAPVFYEQITLIPFDFNSSVDLRREFWGEAPSCLSAGGECGGQRPWSVQPSARHKSPTAIEKFMGAVSSMLGNPDFFKNIGNLLKNIVLNTGDLINSAVNSIENLFTKIYTPSRFPAPASVLLCINLTGCIA